MPINKPNEEYYAIFKKVFVNELLKNYRACKTVESKSGLVGSLKEQLRDKKIATLSSLIGETVGSIVGTAGTAAGEKELAEKGENLVVNIGKMTGVIYLLWKNNKKENELEQAERFLEFVEVRKKKAMVTLASEVAERLYFRFRKGIEKLDNSPGDTKGVARLAWFFASAITKNIMQGKIVRNSLNDKVEELLKCAIPLENDDLYCGGLFNKRIRLTTKNAEDKHWTIEGFLLRAPGNIDGEVTQLENSDSKNKDGSSSDDDSALKYAPIVFYDESEAQNYGFKLVEGQELARVRRYTEPNKKVSNSISHTAKYIFAPHFSCCEDEYHQDKLKMAAKKGQIEEMKNYFNEGIGIKREGRIAYEPVNINGRGRAYALCSTFQGLGDKTALIVAAANNQIEAVKLLVEKGANFNLVDSKGLTALDHAINKGYFTIAEYLYLKGAVAEQHDEETFLRELGEFKERSRNKQEESESESESESGSESENENTKTEVRYEEPRCTYCPC